MNLPLSANFWNRARDALAGHASAVARLYDKWSSGMATVDWYQDDRILSLLDVISSFAPRSVLELGFGDGRVLERLARQMPDASFHGVELSSAMMQSASRRCSDLRNVRLFQGDWINPVIHQSYDVIVIKNALHLIPQVEASLAGLRQVSHRNTRLVIVETVSPSTQARGFVKAVFNIIDREHVKLNFFTKRQLLLILGRAGWRREQASIVDQSMSVDDWLKFKVDNERQRQTVKDLLLDAPCEIALQMNIRDECGSIYMLRRQLFCCLLMKGAQTKASLRLL